MSNPNRFHNDKEVARNAVCRNYLIKLGLSNAINNLESVFDNVQYFSASAMGHGIGKTFVPEHILDPFAWLAEQSCIGQCSKLLKQARNAVNKRTKATTQ